MRIDKNTRKNVVRAIAGLFVVLGLLVIVLPAANVATHEAHAASSTICPPPGHCELPQTQSNTNTVRTVMGIAFGIIGSFALLNMTLSGFKYITSAGEPQKTAEAKSGIIYSLIGLIIAISAEALVVFVIKGTGSP